jgi:hypothetical protein
MRRCGIVVALRGSIIDVRNHVLSFGALQQYVPRQGLCCSCFRTSVSTAAMSRLNCGGYTAPEDIEFRMPRVRWHATVDPSAHSDGGD